MPGISKSEPRLDPAFLDVSEKNLKSPTNKTVTSHNQSKKSISPHEVRDSQTEKDVLSETDLGSGLDPEKRTIKFCGKFILRALLLDKNTEPDRNMGGFQTLFLKKVKYSNFQKFRLS